MPGTISLASTVQYINGGGTVTYKGNPGRCVWWQLVGIDAMVEVAAFGSLSHAQEVTDSDGYATAIYTAPVAALDGDQWDRVKVFESIVVP